MPKKTLGFCALAITASATAATCEPGYYLSGGSCLPCNPNLEAYYCTGDDTRQPCPTTDTDYNQFGYTFMYGAEGTWAIQVANKPSHCYAGLWFRDSHGNEFLLQSRWNGTNYWADSGYLWSAAGPGYYLSSYRSTSNHDWYNAVKECTNAPAHAHYTGPGTPDEPRAGGATDYNDCPWACDAGYGRVGDVCEPLCTTGITHIRAGAATAPLFPTRRTTPSLVVRTAGGVCYGNLTVGQGAGINIRINGTTYHLE